MGISVEKELWIETKSAEGKSYFYQSETRQTVWERPDASNAVVMQQDEIQKAVDQSQREEKGWLFFVTFFPSWMFIVILFTKQIKNYILFKFLLFL